MLLTNRIINEVKKLSRFATTNNILFMNGYDRETVPDDVLPLIKKINPTLKDIQIVQTTPEKYLETIRKKARITANFEGHSKQWSLCLCISRNTIRPYLS